MFSVLWNSNEIPASQQSSPLATGFDSIWSKDSRASILVPNVTVLAWEREPTDFS